MSLGKLAARSTVVTLSWQAVRIILHFVSIVLMSRLLSPTDIGLVAMVVAITGLGELLRDFGLTTAAVQARSLSAEEKANLFWLNTLIGLGISVIVYSCAGLIAALYNDERLVAIAQWASLTFVFNGLATQFKAELNRNLKFFRLGLVEAGGQLAGIAALVAYSFYDASYHAIIISVVTTAVASLCLAVAVSDFQPGLPRIRVSISHLVRFGFGLAGTQTVAYVTRNGDNVALGYFWGPGAVGIYSMAYNIVMMPMNQVLVPLTRVAVPLLGKVRDDGAKLMDSLQSVQMITTSAACVMYGGVVGFAEPVVHLIFGEQWLGAVPIIQFMALGGIFRAMGQVSYWLFIVRGHSIEQLKFHLVAQPVTLAIMLIGIPWGGVGVATGLSAGYAALWLTQLAWVGKVTKLDTTPLIRNGLTFFLALGVPLMAIPLIIRNIMPGVLGTLISTTLMVAYVTALILLWPNLRRRMMSIASAARET